MHKAFELDKELWKKRPLKEEYMLYAATGNLLLAIFFYTSSQLFCSAL